MVTFLWNSSDVFELKLPDLGKIIKMRIGHDNKGIAPGWHLREVKILTPFQENYVFPCDKWLDKNEDEGQIERVLYPEKNHSDKSPRRGQGTFVVDEKKNDLTGYF